MMVDDYAIFGAGIIVMANHFDCAGNWVRHPFIVLGIAQNKALGLQFTSVKRDKGRAVSYFDRRIQGYDDALGIAGVHVENGSFDKIVDDFFKQEQYPTLDFDEEDGFAYWSRTSLNDLYVFSLQNSIIYEFDIKNTITQAKLFEIIGLLSRYQWDDPTVNAVISCYKTFYKNE